MRDPFKIFFEDQHLIVLSKAPGLLSQGESTGDENLVDLLRAYFGRNYVGLVHRLDRNTSGLMVVAKRSKSAERLTEQLQNGILVRQYHAILSGTIPENKIEHWEHWLLKNEKTNEVKVVTAQTPKAKLARLKVTSVKNFDHPDFLNAPSSNKVPLTLARFELETGRSHQIRVQSAAMHHPLIGDAKYDGSAASSHSPSPRPSTLFHRPALHSCFLAFEHPMSKIPQKFSEPFAEDIRAAFFAHLE